MLLKNFSIAILLIYLMVWHNLALSDTRRVSISTGGVEGDNSSRAPMITPDGRYVVFASTATNLVAGDTNASRDIFVYDRQTKSISRVSVDDAGVQGNSTSDNPAITPDGRYIVFESLATNLVTGDTNGRRDIFVHDRTAQTTVRASRNTAGTQGNNNSFLPSISSDGRYVAFESDATNLIAVDGNVRRDVFLRDLQTNTTTLISFESTNAGVANNESLGSSISADGLYVAFYSRASNIKVGGTTAGRRHIYVRDWQNTATTFVSVAPDGTTQGNSNSFNPAISADGKYVTFDSVATNLIASDTNGVSDIFVRDLVAATTTRVSVDSSGTQANNASTIPAISADARYVAFESTATNLVTGDTNGRKDIFVHDRQTSKTVRVSLDSYGTQANNTSAASTVSSSGIAAFESTATNLVANDTNGVTDIFVHTGVIYKDPALVGMDMDGDGTSDLTVWKKATGEWYSLTSSSGFANFIYKQWLNPGTNWLPVPGDYDGDKTGDFAVWNKNTGEWWCLQSSTGNTNYIKRIWKETGATNWIPLPGDYDGDGIADMAVFHKTLGDWYILTSGSGFTTAIYRRWGDGGTTNWVPVPGDYDADGTTDIAIWNKSTSEWRVLTSGSGFSNYFSHVFPATGGGSAYMPVPGDYDGDGTTDFSVWKKATGEWYCLQSSSSNTTYLYRTWKANGTTDWIVAPGDYDGDGSYDLAIWKKTTSEWFILTSGSGFTTHLYRLWKDTGSSAWIVVPEPRHIYMAMGVLNLGD